jgi:hypothetical protein
MGIKTEIWLKKLTPDDKLNNAKKIKFSSYTKETILHHRYHYTSVTVV